MCIRDRPPQSSHYSNASADTGKKYIWPVDGGTFWEWGWWDGGYAGHRGVDIGAPYGTDVYAGASGTVIFAGWDNGGLGNAVMILHPDGYTTVYAHNSEIFVSACLLYTSLDLFAVYIIHLCRDFVRTGLALLVNRFNALIACIVVLIFRFIRNFNVVCFRS